MAPVGPLDHQDLGRGVVVPGADALCSAPNRWHRPISLTRTGAPLRIGDDDVVVGRGVEQLIVGVERTATGARSRDCPSAGRPSLPPARCARPRGRCRARRAPSGLTWTRTAYCCWPAIRPATRRCTVDSRLRQDRVGVIVDLVDRHRVGMDGVDQDRAVGRIDLLVGRRVRQVLGQQAAGRVDRGLHVLRRAVDVARQVELQRDRGRAERRSSRSSGRGRGSRRIAARAASRPRRPWSPGWRRGNSR